MTIDNNQQRFNSYQTDNVKNDFLNRSKDKTKHLADETCRLLFGDSTNLLDDILTHPLSIDYFNVYLSLPIFGQRVFYHRTTHHLDFDPPLLPKQLICSQIYEEAKQWLMNYRLNNYIHTDIYIESLLGLLLTKTDDTTIESSSKLDALSRSYENVIEEELYIFSTVTDVRQFYQFLQLTSGIKYWNFFIDSMRLLRSRRSSRSNRIDISYLNFIDKYYSQQYEFRSIIIDLDNPTMPDSTTSDTIWFQMAINAMHQLRVYWLPRYLGEVSLPSRSNIKRSIVKSNQMNNISKSSTEDIVETSSNRLSKTDSMVQEYKLVKFNLGNISYLDYNPRQYIRIQPSEQHDFQQDAEELNEPDINNNINRIDKDCKVKFEDPLPLSSNRSIEDYAIDTNIELFYRIFASDSLAGSPFFEYISQAIPKPDAISYQTCIHFLTDAEILLSIPSGKFNERILRQFISRYLEITATKELPNQIFDNIDEQRIDLIRELMTKDNNQYSLLWKILLKITKFLIPHFLNYIKFDRLRFLVQGKSVTTNLILDDLRHLLPSVNFETFLTDRQNTKEIDMKQPNSNETDFVSRANLINCGEQQNDLRNSLSKNQYNTTEKLINTDEQCQFRPDERFPPLTDNELEQELHRFCTKFEWKDIKIVLGKSFNVPITLPQTNNTTFIDDPLSHKKIKPTSISNEDLKLNSIETFTLDIMKSAREIFEIDRFVSNLMDESLNLFQTNSSFDSIKTDLNSSPLSSVFEEILLTDSSPTFLINNTNNNALESSVVIQDDITSIETKFLSLIGSYFINSPSIIKTNGNFSSQSILFSELENQLSNHSIDHNLDKSSIINITKPNFFHESIRFAQKDASNEVKDTLINHQISSFQTDDQQQLLKFIQNQITNHQWPLQEYIGIKGQRAWRALKLATDISNLDNGFILNYHNDLDWISTNDNFGSFGERTYLIRRNFTRRIEQQKRCMNKNI